MDPFDEFEMKPITEGLGFHKKAVNLKNQTAKAELGSDLLIQELPSVPHEDLLGEDAQQEPKRKNKSAEQALEELMATLNTPISGGAGEGRLNQELRELEIDLSDKPSAGVQISSTLPRSEGLKRQAMEVEIPAPSNPISNIDIFPDQQIPDSRTQLIQQKKPVGADVGTRRGAADSPMGRLVPAPVSVASSILDSIVVLALSLVFLMSLLLVTKVNLAVVLANVQTDLTTQMAFLVLYLAVLQIYVVISRSFFGCTLGEWTFDFQMGDNAQIKKSTYPILVMWRSVVIVLTGVVVLPFLSFIVRKDLASYLTGLQLYRKKI